MSKFRYPLNRLQDIKLLRSQSQTFIDPRLYPEAETIDRQIQYVSSSGGGLFSCGMLDQCRDTLCKLVADCTSGSSEGVWCSQTDCNRLKDILEKVVACLPDCQGISEEDKSWLGVQEWEWLIWDELNTPLPPHNGLIGPQPVKLWQISLGNAQTCPSERALDCEQNWGCQQYDTEITYGFYGTDRDYEYNIKLYNRAIQKINGVSFYGFRASRSNIYPVRSAGYYNFLLDEETVFPEILLIYPTEVLGQRNLTGFRVLVDASFIQDNQSTALDYKLEIGSIDLRFADVIYSQVLQSGQTYNIRIHDDFLSGNINSSASDSLFMFVRIRPLFTATGRTNFVVRFNTFKVYAITTAPPPSAYQNYNSFLKSIQQTGTIFSQGARFDSLPLPMTYISYSKQNVEASWEADSTISNPDKMFHAYEYVDKEGCGDIPACGCCCQNVRDSACGYCKPFDLPPNKKFTPVYLVSNQTEVGEGGLTSDPDSTIDFAVPSKLLQYDLTCLEQLD